ncbi:MAG: choice-of-anchor J domain-containing protein [Bacteroidales bacterium]|nr:choice-of-anchor J domain-containing protein [Bacteroidales bacterium]
MRRNIVLPAMLAVGLGLTAPSYAADKPTIFTPAGGVKVTAISDNGLYGISETAGDEDEDNPKAQGGSLINLETNTSVNIAAPNGWASVSDVADNGIVVGANDGFPGYWDPTTEEWTTFSVATGWDGGQFMAVTPDAKYAVGLYSDDSSVYHVHPMMYDLTTGEALEIKSLPEVDLDGVDSGQNLFYGISADGRYCLGQMSQSFWMPVSPLTYIYDTLNGTWWPIGYDYDAATKTYTPRDESLYFIVSQYMSTSGNYVAGTAYFVKDGGSISGGSEGYASYLYEVETDNFQLFVGDNDQDFSGDKATNDGTLLACAPSGNPYPTAYVRTGNFFVSLDQILEQVYGVSLENYINDYVTGTFQALSADGLIASMVTYDNCYIIKMPESFADAAAKVNLLTNYTVSIPDGTAMSKISEIKLTFDRDIAAYGDSRCAELLKSDGSLVRNSSGFQVATSNSKQLVVTFRSTDLTPGETYTVRIPAEMVWLQDDPSLKSEEILLTYIGRADGAVQVVSVSPVSGAAVSQLNSSTSYITVTYDCAVSVSDDGAATLYDEAGNAVAALSASYTDNQVYFYPLSTYYLYYGSTYTVVIAEGTVTDLSGQGGSEELTLEYVGTYVRELSSDDQYVYYNTCSDYDNFLQWKNEIHTPGDVATNWGFDVDNMWILVRESSDSDDWAYAAHSMYATPNQSDDWLVTPQLYIPDANTYLSFDAQSYLMSKQDVLRVYIYSTDAVYNYLSEEITNRMREDGDLVVEEVLTPGESEEGLAGDWTHFTVDLAKYAGKNIYIAFVNYNYDQSAIFLDNVMVVRDLNFRLTNQAPTVVVGLDSQEIKGLLSVVGELADYQGITFRLVDADGNVVSTIEDANAELKYGDIYNFAFPTALPLEVGTETTYTIEVISGETDNVYTYQIKDLLFQPTKRVVLEEYAGMDCGNCPQGIVAIEYLEKLYPENLIPIAIRSYQGTDPLGAGVADYSAALGLDNMGAPSARINRGTACYPMYQGTDGYTFVGAGLYSSDGTEQYLWADAMAEEMEITPEAEINLSVEYDTATGDISVPCEVHFALNTSNRSISVFGVVIENQLSARQTNDFYQTDDPLFGEWGLGGMYGSYTVRNWVTDDVARYPLCGDSYTGTLLPYSHFTTDETYTITLSGTVPEGRLTNSDNCEVVVMVIDNGTGKVINANVTAFATSGIGSIEADENVEAVYYNLQGMRVQHPESGKVYIRIQGKKATKIIY